LQQLLAGALQGAEQSELMAHLEGCGPCQRALEELAGGAAGLKAATVLRQTPYAQETPLRRVLDHFKTEVPLTVLRTLDDPPTLVSPLRPSVDAQQVLGALADYEVTEVLGQGGMGVVLEAYDPALARWVALKVLVPDLARDGVARERFAREARAAAAVRHPHVVVIHAVREANGLPYLVMEHVAGGSLQDYLDHHGPPDWREIARLGAEVASGLAAAHARGLIHRDVKPSNILLQTDGSKGGLGTAKISDFGLARLADESRLTQTGILTGTPMYMAPEQAEGQALDCRADLFSLGSVLYTLCTGREPFSGEGPMAVLHRVCTSTPTPIREINPAIPAWLAATVERLHAKRPADRFASAAEVEQLLRWNLDHPGRPRFPTPLPARRRWTRARQLAAVALLGLLLGGLIVGESVQTPPGGTSAEPRGEWVPLRTSLLGHTGPVWSVAFSPDGKTLATGSDDATLRFWDAATGRETDSLPGHNSPVLLVAFAHSGKFLLSSGGDSVLRLWDAVTHQEQAALPHHGGNVRRAPISPDDRTVAVGSSTQGVELWDLKARSIRRTLAGGHGTILPIAFAPNGRTLATGDTSGLIRFWDPATGDEQASFRGDPLGLRALAFAPDGATLASAGTGDRDVKLWDVAARQTLATLTGYENDVLNLAFSPDGRRLATGSRDGKVKIWDVPSARLLVTLAAHRSSVWSVAFSPDGRTLATAGEDRVGRLWDLGGLDGAAP
jgi:WD40 repeat protein/serine/threonine protein kinase